MGGSVYSQRQQKDVVTFEKLDRLKLGDIGYIIRGREGEERAILTLRACKDKPLELLP